MAEAWFFLGRNFPFFLQNTLYLSQVSGLGGHGPWFWLRILPPPLFKFMFKNSDQCLVFHRFWNKVLALNVVMFTSPSPQTFSFMERSFQDEPVDDNLPWYPAPAPPSAPLITFMKMLSPKKLSHVSFLKHLASHHKAFACGVRWACTRSAAFGQNTCRGFWPEYTSWISLPLFTYLVMEMFPSAGLLMLDTHALLPQLMKNNPHFKWEESHTRFISKIRLCVFQYTETFQCPPFSKIGEESPD